MGVQSDGVHDFSHYSIDPNTPFMQALLNPAEENVLPVSEDLFICINIINNIRLHIYIL